MKKAELIVRQTTATSISVTCPYCHTCLNGWGLSRDTIVLRCWHCKRKFEIVDPDQPEQPKPKRTVVRGQLG